jgi:hypothetical protein
MLTKPYKRRYDAEHPWATHGDPSMTNRNFQVLGEVLVYDTSTNSSRSSSMVVSASVAHRADASSPFVPIVGMFPVLARNRHCNDHEHSAPYKREEMFDFYTDPDEPVFYEAELTTACVNGTDSDVDQDVFGNGYHACRTAPVAYGFANTTRAWLPGNGMRSVHMVMPASVVGSGHSAEDTIACCDLFPLSADEDCEMTYAARFEQLSTKEERLEDIRALLTTLYNECQQTLDECRHDTKTDEIHKRNLTGALAGVVFASLGLVLGALLTCFYMNRRARVGKPRLPGFAGIALAGDDELARRDA